MVRNGDKEGVLKNTNGCINDDIVMVLIGNHISETR